MWYKKLTTFSTHNGSPFVLERMERSSFLHRVSLEPFATSVNVHTVRFWLPYLPYPPCWACSVCEDTPAWAAAPADPGLEPAATVLPVSRSVPRLFSCPRHFASPHGLQKWTVRSTQKWACWNSDWHCTGENGHPEGTGLPTRHHAKSLHLLRSVLITPQSFAIFNI